MSADVAFQAKKDLECAVKLPHVTPAIIFPVGVRIGLVELLDLLSG